MTHPTSTTLRLPSVLPADSLHRPRAVVAALQRSRWGIIVLALGAALAVAYLLLVNNTATSGLSLKGYQQQIAQLEEETRQLEIELANLQSFSTIERAGKALELTQVVTPEFVVAPDDSVALR